MTNNKPELKNQQLVGPLQNYARKVRRDITSTLYLRANYI